MDKVQTAIEKGAALKHVDTDDKSKPVLEKVQVKKVDREGFLKEVEGVDSGNLKKTEEKKDSSAPKIEAGTSVQQVDRVAQLQTVKHGVVTHGIESYKGTGGLKAVDEASDRSAPVIEKDVKVKSFDKSGLLAEVAKGPEGGLKPTEEKKDSSAPKLEAEATVRHVDRVAQMQDVKHGAVAREIEGFKGAAPLQSPEGPKRDASAPVIDKDIKVKPSVRGDLMAEVNKGVEGGLKPTEEKKDSSAPKLEAGATVQHVDRMAQMQAIMHGAVARDIEGLKGAPSLQTPDTTHDTSAPVIDPDVKLKTIDRKGLVAGVTEPPQLKPAQNVRDASAPAIEKDAKVKPNAFGAVLKDVEKTEEKK